MKIALPLYWKHVTCSIETNTLWHRSTSVCWRITLRYVSRCSYVVHTRYSYIHTYVSPLWNFPSSKLAHIVIQDGIFEWRKQRINTIAFISDDCDRTTVETSREKKNRSPLLVNVWPIEICLSMFFFIVILESAILKDASRCVELIVK